MTRTRILLVDDHEVVRLGLMTLLDDQPGMQVVGEAGSAAEALRAVERLQPDIVLMDIRMPGEDGITATRQITQQFPQTQVLMLTSFADDELLLRAIRAGAAGYVLKQVGNAELVRAIGAVTRGEALLDPAMTARLLARVRDKERRAEGDPFRALSDRELELLAQIAHGKTNDEIAATLSLSEKTVRNYVSSIREKLGLNNRIELALFAMEHDIFNRVPGKRTG
ncbi:MAG: response regulator transcription factor [Chloroflexi bacterium]|nr:response regulator transcription factor [Chloroflexota bacterium]